MDLNKSIQIYSMNTLFKQNKHIYSESEIL